MDNWNTWEITWTQCLCFHTRNPTCRYTFSLSFTLFEFNRKQLVRFTTRPIYCMFRSVFTPQVHLVRLLVFIFVFNYPCIYLKDGLILKPLIVGICWYTLFHFLFLKCLKNITPHLSCNSNAYPLYVRVKVMLGWNLTASFIALHNSPIIFCLEIASTHNPYIYLCT